MHVRCYTYCIKSVYCICICRCGLVMYNKHKPHSCMRQWNPTLSNHLKSLFLTFNLLAIRTDCFDFLILACDALHLHCTYVCNIYVGTLLAVQALPVLRIRNILVRILIRGSVPRTNWFGSGSGPCYGIFVIDLQDDKKRIFFLLITFWITLT